eukprot:8225699-Alexandrium_andersonii.AAC.1
MAVITSSAMPNASRVPFSASSALSPMSSSDSPSLLNALVTAFSRFFAFDSASFTAVFLSSTSSAASVKRTLSLLDR